MPPPRSKTNGALPGPWRRGSSENRRLRLPGDDPRAPADEQLELLQEPTRVGSSEKGKRDRATTGEPPREGRVIRGRWKPAPRQVEEAVPVAGRTADRPDLAGRRRWCRFVEVGDGPVRMNEADRRLASAVRSRPQPSAIARRWLHGGPRPLARHAGPPAPRPESGRAARQFAEDRRDARRMPRVEPLQPLPGPRAVALRHRRPRRRSGSRGRSGSRSGRRRRASR